MLEYSEIPPPPTLAGTVECFWISKQSARSAHEHLVSPDGCADLLFTQDGDRAKLQFVGPMTTFAHFPLPPGQLAVAARFHPGCWTSLVQTSADLLIDQVVPFEDFEPEKSRRLCDQLQSQSSWQRRVQLLAASIDPEPESRLSSVLTYLAKNSGDASLASVAVDAGLSTRQFRRQIKQQTGLSPKLLARIYRFRRAAKRLRQGIESHATIAAACGYFDQSHLIAEYRRFTGTTPGAATTAFQPASMPQLTRSLGALRQNSHYRR